MRINKTSTPSTDPSTKYTVQDIYIPYRPFLCRPNLMRALFTPALILPTQKTDLTPFRAVFSTTQEARKTTTCQSIILHPCISCFIFSWKKPFILVNNNRLFAFYVIFLITIRLRQFLKLWVSTLQKLRTAQKRNKRICV